jgi:YndJ-like protein
MCVNRLDTAGWTRACVGIGGVLWALVALAWAFGLVRLDALEVLLLLALFVITPLAVSLAPFPSDSRLPRDLKRLIDIAWPGAALAGGASFLVRAGPLAAAVAAVWLLFTALLALAGVIWLFHARGISLADACLALALVYLPSGAAWFVLARLGSQPLGFSQTTVLLTAVHFHFITLAALILTGLTGRAVGAHHVGWPRTAYRVAAVGMLIDPLLVAAGITLTQVTGIRFPESAAAILLALSLLLIAALSLRFVVPATTPPLARGLLAVSGASVFLTMALACAYAVGAATGAWAITIPQMIAAHGWVNALGFGFCGLLGWRVRLNGTERQH